MHSPLPTVRDSELSKDIARITVEERAMFMLDQIAAGPGAAPPVKAMPQDPRERLLMPVLMPHQLRLARMVLDPKGPSVISVMGGIGVGKTAALGYVLGLVALTRPGSHSMLVGHTQKNLSKNVLPFINICLSQPRGRDPIYHYDREQGCYVLDNGSVIWISHYRIAKGADESTNPIEGSNISGLFCVEEAEAINPMVMQHALDRLRGETVDLNGNLCGPTLVMNGRPAGNRWWMRAGANLSKKLAELDFAEGGGLALRGGAQLIAKTKDNYHLDPGYLLRQRLNRTLEEFLAITECAPAPARSAYYSHFKTMNDDAERIMWPESNLVPASQYAGPGLVRVGVDPGLNNPATVVYRIVPARDPRTGKVYDLFVILATIAPHRGSLANHISEIHGMCDRHGWVIEAGRVDPAGVHTQNSQTMFTDVEILERDRDDYDDPTGPGLGVYFDRIEDANKRIVLNGVKRIQALICNAMEVPERRLVCTDAYWDWAEAQEQNSDLGADQPKTWAYTVRAYTKEVVSTKRTQRRDHDSTHVADALRYAVVIDYWDAFGFDVPTHGVNNFSEAEDAEAAYAISNR